MHKITLFCLLLCITWNKYACITFFHTNFLHLAFDAE